MAKRTVYFYDIILSAKGKSRAEGNTADFSTHPKSLRDIASHISQLYLAGDNFLQKGYAANSPSNYIQDFRLEKDRAIFLINRSDPSAPDSVSSDPTTKSRIVHKKPNDHGGEYSAHIILFLDAYIGQNQYLCIFESAYGSGLNATTIHSYIGHIIRHCKKQLADNYKIPNINRAVDKNGDPLMVHHIHDVTFRGHPSDQFVKDLENGQLSSVELVSYSGVGAAWDERGFVKERKRTVTLEPSADLIGDTMSALRGIRNTITKQHQEYKQIRLKFVTESGDTKDATMLSDTGILEAPEAYVKKHSLNMGLIKTNSFDEIQELIIKKMVSYI
ncbi:hypothetical protein JQR88_11030 [Pseudomonas luteola]|uniref:hypothetical protein n=1 Tax=Pseudomonas luteola TaxID=47886 RepID=UPI003DA09178